MQSTTHKCFTIRYARKKTQRKKYKWIIVFLSEFEVQSKKHHIFKGNKAIMLKMPVSLPHSFVVDFALI